MYFLYIENKYNKVLSNIYQVYKNDSRIFEFNDSKTMKAKRQSKGNYYFQNLKDQMQKCKKKVH